MELSEPFGQVPLAGFGGAGGGEAVEDRDHGGDAEDLVGVAGGWVGGFVLVVAVLGVLAVFGGFGPVDFEVAGVAGVYAGQLGEMLVACGATTVGLNLSVFG